MATKQTFGFHLPVTLIDKLRDACEFEGRTMSTIAEEALLGWIAAKEKDIGQELPPRKNPTKRGRPWPEREQQTE